LNVITYVSAGVWTLTCRVPDTSSVGASELFYHWFLVFDFYVVYGNDDLQSLCYSFSFL